MHSSIHTSRHVGLACFASSCAGASPATWHSVYMFKQAGCLQQARSGTYPHQQCCGTAPADVHTPFNDASCHKHLPVVFTALCPPNCCWQLLAANDTPPRHIMQPNRPLQLHIFHYIKPADCSVKQYHPLPCTTSSLMFSAFLHSRACSAPWSSRHVSSSSRVR
jgi:hypothetical protein